MTRQSNQWSPAEKARWLAELARAIDEAQQVVWRLSTLREDTARASELYGRLETARDEVERLQRGSKSFELHLDEEWKELVAVGSGAAAFDPAHTPCGSSPPPPKARR